MESHDRLQQIAINALVQQHETTLRAVGRIVSPAVDFIGSVPVQTTLAEVQANAIRTTVQFAKQALESHWWDEMFPQDPTFHLPQAGVFAESGTLFDFGYQVALADHFAHQLLLSKAAEKQLRVELRETPFRFRSFLNAQLRGAKSLAERLRIIREFNRIFSQLIQLEQAGADIPERKPPPAAFVHKLILGIIKILFSPLKINLQTLHPTKSLA